MGTRLSTDLGDPRLLRQLKAEENQRETTVKEVLTRALEACFADRLGTRALARLAERPSASGTTHGTRSTIGCEAWVC